MITKPRSLTVGASTLGTFASVGHAEHCPDINGPRCAAMPVPEQWHDLGLVFGELRLRAEYGIRDGVAIGLEGSVRVTQVDFELQDAQHNPIDPPFGEEIHHRDEVITGPSDPVLGIRVGKAQGPWALIARAGATIPIGTTVTNPFRLGREGESHQHLQYGTGTVIPIVEVEIRRAFGPWSLATTGFLKLPLYENDKGYRAGTQVVGGVRVARSLAGGRWSAVAGLLINNETAERWDGRVESEGNLGRTDLLVDLGLSWKPSPAWSLGVSVKLSAFSESEGAQLTTPAVGELSLTRAIDFGN